MNATVLDDPGQFTSERIVTSLEEENEPQYNDIDLTSHPSHEAAHVAPSSPRRSPSPFYDPVEWNIAQLSPGGVSFSSGGRSSHVQNDTNLVNAVHMHVQENARIPNYNQPVDRSNSSSKTYQRNNYSFDTLLSSHQVDNSMAELFLSSESNNRRSLNQTYEVLGSLSTEDTNFPVEIDALESFVDPTPWSEIEDKIHVEKERTAHLNAQQRRQENHQHTQQQQYESTKSTATAVSTMPQHPHHSSYYPYGRHHQLPIPEKNSLPQNSRPISSVSDNSTDNETSRLAEAIAIAAAIVCTSTTDNKIGRTTEVIDKAPAIISVSGKLSTLPSISESQNKTLIDNSHTNPPGPPSGITRHIPQSQALISSQHLQRQRANDTMPPYAAAHAVSSASVLAAANRKSQYGFGGNHTVPSVPAPPSFRPSTQHISRPKIVRIPDHKKAVPSIKPPIPIPILLPAKPEGYKSPVYVQTIGTTVSAYERKKQRAKDARIKLNESIDRLAIAVSLAGSQSRHRIDQLENQIINTEFRQKSIQVNKEGIDLAEEAKKWDRPSFVGTAASVIQSLNAQCEALMAELSSMQKLLDAEKVKNGSGSNFSNDNLTESPNIEAINEIRIPTSNSNKTNTAAINHETEQDTSYVSHQTQKRIEQPSEFSQNNQISNKRPRMEIRKEEDSPSDDEIVYAEIAKMLDPVSLCHCACVSKLWSQRQSFHNDDIWLNLAVKRFGYYNVRQWSENLREGEEMKISNKHLYREMNAMNLMPHFSQEGLSLLGNGKIQGRICGWVFLVERSNGETLRSVKCEPSTVASGGGSYQSRPVVELRIVIQNIGMGSQPIILKPQKIGVDISTRRRGGEFEEIDWDERFKKVVRNTDGTIRIPPLKNSNNDFQEDLCWLELFETAVIEVHINVRGCSTISKFRQRSNYTKLLVSLDGTTVPMVIPFLRDNNMH